MRFCGVESKTVIPVFDSNKQGKLVYIEELYENFSKGKYFVPIYSDCINTAKILNVYQNKCDFDETIALRLRENMLMLHRCQLVCVCNTTNSYAISVEDSDIKYVQAQHLRPNDTIIDRQSMFSMIDNTNYPDIYLYSLELEDPHQFYGNGILLGDCTIDNS